MSIKSRMLEFLSSLPNVETSGKRQALITFTGFDHLSNQIEWEGNSLEFFSGLIETLARQGKSELLVFVDELAKSPWVSDIGQKEKLTALRGDIEKVAPDEWYTKRVIDGISFEELILRCKKATVQEIKIVGSKYISELYFPRYRLEAKFERFLNSDTTCFLVVAKAGRGKTNLMCRIVEEWQDKRPILFLAGRKEPKDDYDFLKHIAIRLGYDENWPVCLKDLKSVSKPGLEPLILIDGINESSAKPSIMQAALRELLVQTALHQIKVCVTCRTDFWRFYRAPFWAEYIWKDEKTSLAGKVIRGEDLQSFPEENFSEIVRSYFEYFGVQGELIEEAWERCRNPLLLRFFCEAYRDRVVQTVSQIRLYPLFKLFWSRKIEQVQDLSGLPQPYPVNQFVLTIARLMRQRHQTKVPRDNITQVVGSDIMQSDSLYFRVLDEEIILEEEVDELAGTTNVIFVYDKFSEYAIALSIFSDFEWYEKGSSIIKDEATDLMREEAAYEFATLRGALEFAVLRVEDQRLGTGIHFDIIKAMLDHDWKWRRIGSLLAFQLTQIEADSYWKFIDETLIKDERDFVRRICAEQIGRLTVYNANRALPLLNKCLKDESPSVRQVARETLLNLDPTVAIQEAKLLVTEKPFGAGSVALAAETLLSPVDSLSLLLQNKAHWLVKENRNNDIQEALFDFLANLDFTLYEDLYVLEQYERAFQVGWRRNHRPSNAYLEIIQQHLVPKRNALEVDLKRLETLRTIRNSLFDFAVKTFDVRRSEPNAVWKADLNLLEPDAEARKDFLGEIEGAFQVSLPKWIYDIIEDISDEQGAISQPWRTVEEDRNSITMEALAIEITRSTSDFADQPSASHLVSLPLRIEDWYYWPGYNYETSRLMRLCQITDDLILEAATLLGEIRSTIALDIPLGQNGLKLEPDKCNTIRNRAASKIGLELNAVQHRNLSNLGRLSIWLWQAEETSQQQEKILEKKIEEVRHLETNALQQRLSIFENLTSSEEAGHELVLELQAICRTHAVSQPNRVVETLTPLIIWHNENEISVLSQSFQSLHWRERDSFWNVAQLLLEHEDQRIIDFASQVLEQAEYIEENLGSSEVFDKVRAIIVDQLGVDESEITWNASFRDDLEADSLDLVELIMAFEEEFGGEITDNDAELITTVGEAVEYLAVHIR